MITFLKLLFLSSLYNRISCALMLMVQSLFKLNIMDKLATQAQLGLMVAVMPSLLLQAPLTQGFQQSTSQVLSVQRKPSHLLEESRIQYKRQFRSQPNQHCAKASMIELNQIFIQKIQVPAKSLTQQVDTSIPVDQFISVPDPHISCQVNLLQVNSQVSQQEHSEGLQQKSSSVSREQSLWRQVLKQSEPDHGVGCALTSTADQGSKSFKNSFLFPAFALITLVSLNIKTIFLQILATHAKSGFENSEVLNKFCNLFSRGINTNCEYPKSDSAFKNLLQWAHTVRLKTVTFF